MAPKKHLVFEKYKTIADAMLDLELAKVEAQMKYNIEFTVLKFEQMIDSIRFEQELWEYRNRKFHENCSKEPWRKWYEELNCDR